MNFGKPKKLFVVDDDKMFTELLTDYLASKGSHNISSFLTGEECLKHISENPDVIILDYHLDSVNKNAANGMLILQAIKKNYPKVHVIMLSSQERYSLAMQTIQKGAEQYVIKDDKAFEKILKMINEI